MGAIALLITQVAYGAGPYRVDAYTVESGGGYSAAGRYVVTGTAGQMEADPAQASHAGSYAVVGGYWGTGAKPPMGTRIFRSDFE